MKIKLEQFDHPLTFVFLLTLVLFPMFVLVIMGAQKIGLFTQQTS